MPNVRFDAWVNALNLENDPGHMVMFDEPGGFYYELAMGPLFKETHPRFGHSVSYIDTRDKVKKTSKTREIRLNKCRKEAYYREQLMKTRPNSTTFRFTHLFYIDVELSHEMYRALMATTITRGLFGFYNFCAEAQEEDMLIAHCGAPLEFVARMRGVQLKPDTPLKMIMEFGKLFNCPVVQEQL